ncbi:MAG: hypothetical protein HW388_901 [Dehalococcoidia bacterium]|nr:hypothetical protein [Dehalococcoidia bacterium]
MPIYEYVCSTCRNRFEKLRPMASVEEAASCPDCGSPAKKALSVFASFSRSAGGEMPAMAGGGECAYAASGQCACCSV